jgi:hypothetical protein
MKRKLEISKLNRILSFLYGKDMYVLQYAFFDWCIRGLMLEETFDREFKLAGKELLKHFDIPQLDTIDQINEYFLEIYNVHHPIRNNLETMDSIEEVRQFLKS